MFWDVKIGIPKSCLCKINDKISGVMILWTNMNTTHNVHMFDECVLLMIKAFDKGSFFKER